ncbi:MAG: AAA family ATPase [Brevibacillus sp.]|nr:AAA family ATPase [Brevibacillus sp.]
MRPIQLKLAGLHSYREMQVIDFERLCEAGLFGIFGPTGSGKSTILDAITLALYGQVVRMGGATHPLQVLNQLEERLFVSFTFELGRDGSRRRYTIEREFGLDKKGNRRPPEVRLIERGLAPDEADRVLESKATAATAAVEQLIGLTIHDFTRAVVLPQGQFSRFLTLRGSERNEMLQRIFQLEEYGEKLNERIRTRYEWNKAERHRLELELAGLGDAGPEALQAATAEWNEASRLERGLVDEWQALAEKKKELDQLREWQKERETIIRKLDELAGKQPEIEQMTQLIAQIERSLSLWPRIERLRQLAAERAELAQRCEQLRVGREAASAEVCGAEEQLRAVQTRVRTEEPLLHEQRSRLALGIEWEKELEGLTQELGRLTTEQSRLQEERKEVESRLLEAERQASVCAEEWNRLEQLEQELTAAAGQRGWLQALRDAKLSWQGEEQKLSDARRELAELERKRQEAQAEVERQRAAWEGAAAFREQAQAALGEVEEKLGQTAAEQELDELRQQLVQVRTIGKAWREWTQARHAWEKRQSDWHQRLREAEKRAEEAEAAWRRADTLCKERERERQEAEHARLEWQKANMALALRRALRDGEPCPVCGSLHHPHRLAEPPTGMVPDDQPLAEHEWQREEAERIARVDRAVLALREAETVSRQAYERLLQAKTALKSLREQEQALREEEDALNQRLAAIRSELARLDERWTVDDVDTLSIRYQQTERDLAQMMEKRSALRQQLEQLQQRAAGLRERELEQKGQYEKQMALLERLDEAVAAASERVTTSQRGVELAVRRLDELRGTLPVEEIDPQYARLAELDTQLQQLREQRRQLERDRRQIEEKRQVDSERQLQLAARESALNEKLSEIRDAWENKRKQLHALTGGEQAAACLAAVERQLEQLQSAFGQAEQAHQEAVTRLQAVQESLWKSEEALTHLIRRYEDESAAITEEIASSGLESLEQVSVLYAKRESLDSYRKQVEQFRTLSQQLRYDEQRLRERLNGRQVTTEEWQQLAQALEEMEMALANSRERAAVARQTLARIEQNHQRWLQLYARLGDLEAEQSRLEELKKLFEGKAFVQFIAEEKLTSIARDASYHLARMTQNRYALEIGADGEFVLRDEAAGGLKRPVSTLSGGETFLTSLALALALSVEIQMRGGKLEFFFLDEGFGTLDPELLDVVLHALERLRMDDFTIGLISHVPEMRARLPRRLIVTPAEPMGAGSRIQLEIE